MARKASKASDVRQMQQLEGDPGGEEMLEFNEAKASAEDLAAVTEAEGDTGAMQVEERLIKACDSLEEGMGGLVAGAEGLVAPSDNPSGDLSNIVGYGIGEKVVGGHYTGQLAVKVYVREKVAASQVSDEALVAEEVDGYPTDVEEVGDISALRFTGKYRPAPGGSSVGHPRVTAGTLGCLMVRSNNHVCILSNNHVLANCNNARPGDATIQPGTADGGQDPRDRIGVLETFVPITFGGTVANCVDAAASWTNFRLASPRMHCYTINPVPVNVALGTSVRKCGRTTQGTLGVITGIHVTINVGYGIGPDGKPRVAKFREQVQIRGVGREFSAGGDSGSLVVTAGTRQPVALLFAGGGGFTYANPICLVIGALSIRRFLC